MTAKRICRVLCLALVFAMLLTVLCACSPARKLRPNSRANRVVAKVGELEITYDMLYYVTMNRIADLKSADPNALSTPEQQAELKEFVKAALLTPDTAMLLLAKQYGLEVDRGVIANAVQEDMDAILAEEYQNDRKLYIKSLNDRYLTDHYARTFLALDEHFAPALVEAMLKAGDIDDSDERAKALLESNDFIRTVQIVIKKNNGKSDEENKANAKALYDKLSQIADPAERYDEMHKQIGGKYNNDMSDTLGNGYYFAKGQYQEAYEAVAFNLPDRGVGQVELADGYYIIMRMPKNMDYVNANFQEFKEQTYYLQLNQKLDNVLSLSTLEMTRYGESLDLLDLPPISANGGAAGFVIVTTLAVAVCVGGIVLVCGMLAKRKTGAKKGGKKVKVRLLSPKSK